MMSYNGWANRETWLITLYHGEMFAEIAEDAVGRGDSDPHELAETFRTVFFEIDEVDSVLIDEARTPLIISGQAEQSTQLYYVINGITPY